MADEKHGIQPIQAAQSGLNPIPQWRADELRNAMQMFSGRDPNKPVIDTSPNRGAGWLGKR